VCESKIRRIVDGGCVPLYELWTEATFIHVESEFNALYICMECRSQPAAQTESDRSVSSRIIRYGPETTRVGGRSHGQ
jgi:hypothetical protein